MDAVTILTFLSRKHAKFSNKEGGAASTSNISEAKIEAVKQEWANLVLLDDK